MARGQQKTQVNIGGTSSGAGEANAQPKKRKRGSRVVKKSVKDLFPILTTRTTPKVLVEAMASFTDEQKHAVVEMGFESLLMLRISKFPGRLVYWLTENFNPMSSELVLSNGKYLHIDWKDVQSVLGFPNGPLAIDKKSRSESCRLYEEWPALFGREHYRMTPTEVCGKMAGCEDGGVWFRRYFTVLVHQIIVGSMQGGYISPLILNCLEDVSNIRKFNWCQYTLKTLIEKRINWGSSIKKTEFNGPLLFLTVLYVDRVVVGARDMPRGIPSFLGWSTDKIKERNSFELNNGGYGFGFVDGPYDGEGSSGCNDAPMDAPAEKHDNIQGSNMLDGGVQQLTSQLASKLSCIATDVVDIISILQNAPDDVSSDSVFGRMRDAARNLIFFSGKQGDVQRTDDVGDGSATQQNEAFWNNPENIAILEKIESAVLKRNEFTKTFDGPSFSIGLTQVGVMEGWDSIMETSRQYSNVFSEAPLEQETAPGDKPSDDQDRNDAGGHAKEGNIHGNEASAAVNVGKEVGKAASKTGQKKLKKSSVVGAPVVGLCTSSHEIDPSSDPDEMQQMVAKWMFEKTGADEEELVYKVGDRSLWRREMESLRHGEYVFVDVVSVWSMILNARESLRSKSAPTRFFATAYSTTYSIVVPKYRLDDKSALAIFSASFDAEVGVETTAKLQKIELFFFPICKSEHLFVIVFDMKRRNCHILDNSAVGGTTCDKYEKTPEDLMRVFSLYLSSRGCDQMSWSVKNAKLSRLSMPWRDSENKVDCGIFAMRHMETYMGGGARGWDCGLKKGGGNLISNLRIKYCYSIISEENNEQREKSLMEARKFWMGKDVM